MEEGLVEYGGIVLVQTVRHPGDFVPHPRSVLWPSDDQLLGAVERTAEQV